MAQHSGWLDDCQAASSRPVIITRKIVPGHCHATAVVSPGTITLLIPPADRPVTPQERHSILRLIQGDRGE